MRKRSDSYMKEAEDILDRKATLYRIPSKKDPSQTAPNWHCAYYLPVDADGTKRQTVRESLKTKNIDEARRKAERRYSILVSRVDAGNPVQDYLFEKACKRLIKDLQELYDNGEYSAKRLKQADMAIRRFLEAPEFAGIPLHRISVVRVNAYFNRRKETGPYSNHTWQREAGFLRRLFRLGVQKGYIAESQVPYIQNPTPEIKKRASIDKNEWIRIREHLAKNAFSDTDITGKKGVSEKVKYIRKMSFFYIMMLAHSGLRTGNETRYMQWSDIRFFFTKDRALDEEISIIDLCRELGIDENTLPNIDTYDFGSCRNDIIASIRVRKEYAKKRKMRYVYCDAELTPFICMWFMWSGRVQVNNYVFTDITGAPIKHELSLLKTTLREMDTNKVDGKTTWQKNEADEPRTLYSLRHMVATNAIYDKQISTLSLAANLGTSVKMLEQHYFEPMDDRRKREYAAIDAKKLLPQE